MARLIGEREREHLIHISAAERVELRRWLVKKGHKPTKQIVLMDDGELDAEVRRLGYSPKPIRKRGRDRAITDIVEGFNG